MLDEVGGLGVPLGIAVAERGDLDGLGGVGQRLVLPVGLLGEFGQERLGGVVRVGQLLRAAPARGRALLEQAEGVVVVGGAEVAVVVANGSWRRAGAVSTARRPRGAAGACPGWP